MSEDWLDIAERPPVVLPIPVELPTDYRARLELAEQCFARLTPGQRVFLQAWRDCRFNASAAGRQLGFSAHTKPSTAWMKDPVYATVVKVWRSSAAADAMDRDRLLARHDDIVETALTPKPLLHQGIMVLDTRPGARPGAVLEEVDVGAARSANADLMKAAGLFPKEGAEVNVAVGFTPVQVEIEQSAHDVIDAVVEEVEASPMLPPEEDWLS